MSCDHATGVWYDGSRARWSVFNQDLAAMPLGASFNVAVFGYRSYVTMSLRGY